jgi:DNA-binding transcriptional regulator YiaG
MKYPESAPSPEQLAAFLRATRMAAKMSQGAFAAQLGVTQQKLSDWERGRRLRQLIEAIRVLDVLQRPGL